MVGVQVVVGGDNKVDADLFDFHCKECGRHMIVLVGPETDTCNLCVSHPGWFNDPGLIQTLDPEGHHNPPKTQ